MSHETPSVQYDLLYHPGIPGRGEFIRLAFEAAGVPYRDVANASQEGKQTMYAICTSDGLESVDGNPPVFSPPALRVYDENSKRKSLIISQTPNILAYLGPRIRMVPSNGDEAATYHVQQVAFTALDLNDEVHDTHHPIAVMQYYEDQRPEAQKKAADVRTNRLPKFFSYFQRTLQANRNFGKGKYLVGSTLTYADTTVWQVLDGLYFAFPNEMAARKTEFPELLDAFYESVRNEPRLRDYLSSERRLPYSSGVFRHYPELDR